MAAAPVSVTLEREEVVDFTTPYYEYAGIRILVKKSDAEDNLFTFVDVFHYQVRDFNIWLFDSLHNALIVLSLHIHALASYVYLLDKFWQESKSKLSRINTIEHWLH